MYAPGLCRRAHQYVFSQRATLSTKQKHHTFTTRTHSKSRNQKKLAQPRFELEFLCLQLRTWIPPIALLHVMYPDPSVISAKHLETTRPLCLLAGGKSALVVYIGTFQKGWTAVVLREVSDDSGMSE